MSDIIEASKLTLLLDRIENLDVEKRAIGDDIRDVYAEAKSVGYDTKIMRKIIRLRRMEKHDRDTEDALLDTYRTAVGL